MTATTSTNETIDHESVTAEAKPNHDFADATAKEGIEVFGWGELTPMGNLARAYLASQELATWKNNAVGFNDQLDAANKRASELESQLLASRERERRLESVARRVLLCRSDILIGSGHLTPLAAESLELLIETARQALETP